MLPVDRPTRHARLLHLSPTVRLRREHFGGIACDTQTGAMIEVDRDAFALLAIVQERGVLHVGQANVSASRRQRPSAEKTAEIIELLLRLGVLVAIEAYALDGPASAAPAAAEAPCEHIDTSWPGGPHLTAPETVHWAITHRCGGRCPDCYAERHRGLFDTELSAREALRLVDRLADWGVLQLAIGGGEPLLRDDLAAIAERATTRGLIVHVTTGDTLSLLRRAPALLDSVSAFRVGIKVDRLLAGAGPDVAPLAACARCADHSGVSLGANVMLSRSVLARFEDVVQRVAEAGVHQVTLLRYKPPGSREQWAREAPPDRVLREFEPRLQEVARGYPGIALRVDCALSFLQRSIAPRAAAEAGIRGCVAGQRILAVMPDGSVFPCSQLVAPGLCAGNALTDDLDLLWRRSPVLRRYRGRREKAAFRETVCGACTAREHCGGCPVFADDGWGADPGCPGPLWPDPRALGRHGRKPDSVRYGEQYGCISVREYMERYGVGQKRAIKELRCAGWLLADPDATGRKRSDIYVALHEDSISAIQESIGDTPAGFPYATREQILEWTGNAPSDQGCDYPRWLGS